jgi:protein ImuA
MTHALLARGTGTTRPALALPGGFALDQGRVHEGCGPARHVFAGLVAGAAQAASGGEVLWVAPEWAGARLNPEGLRRFADPGRMLFATPRREEDLLWCAEEALRAGCLALVVAELPTCPALTPVRRLQLAAEAGAAAAGPVPLGLLLTPGAGGARGAETRWWMAPAHAPAAEGWRLERRRARRAPPARWHLAWDGGRLAATAQAMAD